LVESFRSCVVRHAFRSADDHQRRQRLRRSRGSLERWHSRRSWTSRTTCWRAMASLRRKIACGTCSSWWSGGRAADCNRVRPILASSEPAPTALGRFGHSGSTRGHSDSNTNNPARAEREDPARHRPAVRQRPRPRTRSTAAGSTTTLHTRSPTRKPDRGRSQRGDHGSQSHRNQTRGRSRDRENHRGSHRDLQTRRGPRLG